MLPKIHRGGVGNNESNPGNRGVLAAASARATTERDGSAGVLSTASNAHSSIGLLAAETQKAGDKIPGEKTMEWIPI